MSVSAGGMVPPGGMTSGPAGGTVPHAELETGSGEADAIPVGGSVPPREMTSGSVGGTVPPTGMASAPVRGIIPHGRDELPPAWGIIPPAGMTSIPPGGTVPPSGMTSGTVWKAITLELPASAQDSRASACRGAILAVSVPASARFLPASRTKGRDVRQRCRHFGDALPAFRITPVTLALTGRPLTYTPPSISLPPLRQSA